MSLRTKLGLAFLVTVITAMLAGFLIIRSSNTVTENFEFVSNLSAPLNATLQDMNVHTATMTETLTAYYVYLQANAAEGAQIEADEFEEAWTGLQNAIVLYEQLSHDADDTERFDTIVSQAEAFHEFGRITMGLLDSDVTPTILAQYQDQLAVVSDALRETLADAIEDEQAELLEHNETATEAAATSLTVTLLSFGALIAIIGASGLVIFNGVVKPITQLEDVAQRIAEGDYAQRVQITSKDEIGQLGESFNNMAEAVEKRNQELSQLNTDLEYQIAQAEAARLRAEQSDQVKSAFLASMSHELRTPLNSVINFSKFVVKGVMGPVTERQEETLNKVIGSAKHLLNLINDVLDMSKIESGSLNLFIEDEVDVNEILTTVTSTAESLLEDKPVKLELEKEILPTIRGDRQRILQVMLNVLSNACKFTHEGEVKVSARTVGNEILLSVHDTGPGIAPKDQGLVFEPFKQTETGLRQGSGTGLGMPISKKLVEAHGGRLWLESQPGQGATFYVALPVKSESLIPVLA